MSIKGKIFKEIATHLETQVPELIYIDKERGQLEKENELLVPKPAVLVAFLRFEWSDIGNGVKEGKGSIQIRTTIDNHAESRSARNTQNAAISVFEPNETIDNALEGSSGDNLSALAMIGDEDDIDNRNTIVTGFEYETTIVEDSKT